MPHSAAKDRSDFIRPGLSPTATNKAAAVSGPSRQQRRVRLRATSARCRVRRVSRVWYRRSQMPQGTLRVGGGGVVCAGSEPGANSDLGFEIHAL